MVCGRGVYRQIAQHGLGLCGAGLVVPATKDGLPARLVQPVDEHGVAGACIGGHQPLSRAAAEPGDGQPGQRLGKGDHIGLRIAGADTERVQFHDLARQILVETRTLLAAPPADARGDRAFGAEALRLIEIEKHGRMTHRRDQQVRKIAHDVRADRLELVISGKADHRQLVGRNGEMIGPEMRQPFGEGGAGVDRRSEAGIGRRDIMIADRRSRQPLPIDRRVHRPVIRGHAGLGRAPCRGAVLAIIDVSLRDFRAAGERGDRGRGGVELVELAKQRVARMAGGGRIVETAAQAEAVRRQILDRHECRLSCSG